MSRWESALLMRVAAEVLVAFMYRVITAGVIGANIGGGLMILFVVPLVAFLLASAFARTRSTEHAGGGSTVAIALGIAAAHLVLALLSLWGALLLLVAVVAVVGVRLVRAPERAPARC